MAATTAGAIKAHVEALGLSLPMFRDGPRPGQPLPYGVVTEGISIAQPLSSRGDFGDPDAEVVVTEQVQVDLIQQARDSAGRNTERYDLPGLLYRGLHGAQLTQAPGHVYGVRVLSMGRDPIVDNVVRHVLQLQLDRDLLPAT
ncbi:hypothetical protein B4N89_02340 [Embleya scabrispora]|uniref:Uncharacterized protein n=1 Tax=Embleya scabrispora TaxID=159449 RepID=A0A1T3NSR7_9ACTN|nr:hypothetical protein [Embleya scabrispora]OPC79937.1 hypothetical protein B4N89_02340 [Embleya scabrispora]